MFLSQRTQTYTVINLYLIQQQQVIQNQVIGEFNDFAIEAFPELSAPSSGGEWKRSVEKCEQLFSKIVPDTTKRTYEARAVYFAATCSILLSFVVNEEVKMRCCLRDCWIPCFYHLDKAGS